MIFNNSGSVINSSEELSTEAQSMIMEGAIMDLTSPEERQAFLENHTEVNAALSDNILLERTIVRLDKNAKISKAQKIAVFTIAKEKKDPKFKKLLTVWRMERFLENYLMKRYGNEALRRAKQSVSNSQHSKSSLIKKVANNLHSQLNGSTVKK
jgi:hypothetical protein